MRATGGGFSRSISVSPVNSHFTYDPHSSFIIGGLYNRSVSGRSTKWTWSHPNLPPKKLKKSIRLVNDISSITETSQTALHLSVPTDLGSSQSIKQSALPAPTSISIPCSVCKSTVVSVLHFFQSMLVFTHSLLQEHLHGKCTIISVEMP